MLGTGFVDQRFEFAHPTLKAAILRHTEKPHAAKKKCPRLEWSLLRVHSTAQLYARHWLLVISFYLSRFSRQAR